MCNHHNGPTLNQEYNQLLVAWARQGYPSPPECEECSADLTGKKVHDIGIMWVCTECHTAHKKEVSYSEPREDFHADS